MEGSETQFAKAPTNRLYHWHGTTTDPTICRNSSVLNTSGIKLEVSGFSELELLGSLFNACRACGIGKCDSEDCIEFKKTLANLNPRCESWSDLQEWALQVAACICSQKNGGTRWIPEFTWTVNRYNHPAKNFDGSYGVELSDVLGVLAWLNGITTGRYKVLQVPNEVLQQDSDTRQILEAVERAKEYELCPHRVWAIAGSLPGREFNLPALIPLGMHSNKVRHAEHSRCTFDFCEYSRKDFTSQKQRHECSGRNCKLLSFPLQKLEEPALAGNPTAWKLYERSIIEPNQTVMAISHVWADGTGTGPWQAGRVNECLYDFFCRIASQFQCEGIWWDTICIPRDKKARNEAMNNLQSNYVGARITLVHDLYLREWEWVDAESACFAIVMSTWFSRGWTSLELAKSGKVKVLFKSGPSGSLTIKDLDEDILAKPGEPSSPWRQVASAAIFNLRRQRITGINDILTALGPRDTSWPKDMAIISGLLAGVEIPVDPSQHEINQRILRKINHVSQGHLFHSSATMTGGFSWCPNSLLDMPLALTSSTSSTLNILENGDNIGWWRVFSLEAFPSEQHIARDIPAMIRVKIQSALMNKDKHLFLVEVEAASITRALVVKIVREKEELPRWIHCQYVGPLHFIRPQTGGTEKGILIKARIGDVEGMGTLENEKAFDYVLKMAKAENPNIQDAKLSGGKGGENKESGENDRPDPNAEEVIHMMQEKVDDFNSRGKYAKTVLHMAAERGYASAVHLLLDKNNKHDVNVQDSMGRTPLLLAAANGNGAVVELLLKGGADPNLPDTYEQTAPLHRAAWGGFKAIVEQLLNNVANPANPRASDKQGRSALHLAAERGEEDVVQVLLEKVTNLNVSCMNDGQIVLHRAAWGGSTTVVRLLLEKGVDPDWEDNFGRTALHMAAEQGHMGIVHLLLTVINGAASKGHEAVSRLVERGTQIERKNKEGWTMMHCAAHNGHEAVVRMLINMGANIDTKNLYKCTPLRLAVENGHKAIVELLVEKQANINVQDCYGHTALHRASGMGQEAIAQLLVEKMANVNMQDNIGSTALHLAVDAKHERIVQLLVKNVANVNVTAKRTEMPLHLAAQNGHEGIAQFLVEKGAHVNGKIMYGGMAALHLAAERGHEAVVSLLLEKGVDLESRSGDGHTALGLAAAVGNEAMVQLLLEKDANVHSKDSGGNTPLSLAAAWEGYTAQSFVKPESSISFRGSEVVGWQLVEKGAKAKWELVRLLLEKGVNLESINEDGWTILGLAMAWGDKGMVQPLLEKCPNLCFQDWEDNTQLSLMPCNKWISFGGHEMVGRRLVEKGAEVEAKNKGGWTAMHYAAHRGHEGFMRMLIDKGANVDTQNLHQRTPLHLAAEKGREAIVQLLIEKKANIEVEDHTGWCTPLHLAAEEGRQAIVELLIEKQTNLTKKERRWQFTPLQLAARNGHKEVVQLLVKNGALVNRSMQDDDTPLGLAVQNGHEGIAQFLFESGAAAKTALHLAIVRGPETLVRFLLEKGVDVESSNEALQKPLQLAAAWGKGAMVELLLEKGAKYINTNATGDTILSLAASEKRSSFAEHEAIGQLLLKQIRIHYERSRFPWGNVRNSIKSHIDKVNNEGWTAMHHAAHNGHEGFVRMLIENEADINAPSNRGKCKPLHLAAKNGHEAIVRLLVGKGAWIDAQDERHWTALCHAADIEHERIVWFLLENGAHVNGGAEKYSALCFRSDLLHLAAKNGHEAIIRFLVEKGASIDALDEKSHWTALCYATDLGHERIVQFLLENGAHVNGGAEKYGPLHFGCNPLHLAAKNGHEDIVRLLVEKGAWIDAQDEKSGWTALCHAADIGHERIVRFLLKNGAHVKVHNKVSSCVTALHGVARNGHEGIFRLFMEEFEDWTEAWDESKTVAVQLELDVQALDGTGSPLSWAVQYEHEAIVRVLLAKGVSPDRPDNSGGRTPLSWAVHKGNEAIVKLLLLTYFPPGRDTPDYDKRTPLWWAVQKGNKAIVKLLLESGAKPNIKDKDGRTPLSCALEKGDEAIVELLHKKGGNPKKKIAMYDVAHNGHEGLVGMLIKNEANINAPGDTDKCKQLHLAAKNGNEAIIRLLVGKGAWINAQDESHWTALCHAADLGHEKIVQLLLENGAHVNGGAEKYGPLHFGCNPLHLAAKNGHEDIVRLLVKKGAWIDAQDEKSGWTALCHAADIGHERIVRFLLKNGAHVKVHNKVSSCVTALHGVARNGHEGIFRLFMEEFEDWTEAWDESKTVAVQLELDVQALDGTGSPLSWAVQYEHEAIVRVLLAKGVSPNRQDNSTGRTPLLWAVHKGNEVILKLLLLTYFPPGKDTPDYDKRTPLWWAVQKGNKAIVKLLLESGAKPDIDDKDGRTPLSCALEKGDEAIVELLHEKGGNPKKKIAMHDVAHNGHEGLVGMLIENEANVNAPGDTEECKQLHLAAKNGDETIIRLLVGKAAWVNTQDESHWTALCQLLVGRGAWINAQDESHWTALCHAADIGHEKIVQYLLENGAHVNGGAEKYGTLCFRSNPLHLAAKNGHEAIVRLLVEKGAWINALDEKCHWTALCHAADIGHERIVQFLLEHGAHVNVKKSELPEDGGFVYGLSYVTALHGAARNGHEGIFRLLTEEFEDWSKAWDGSKTKAAWDDMDNLAMDGTGTPLSWAVQYEHEAIVRILLTKGANLDGLVIHMGRTPLSWAVEKGNEAIVKLLLLTARVSADTRRASRHSWYANRDIRDHDGRTPLLWAVQNGNEPIVKLLLLTTLLIRNPYTHVGTQPDNPDYDKRTPLWWAVQKGNKAIVKLLLECGAKPDTEDKDGRTPLSCALEKGDEAIVNLLWGNVGRIRWSDVVIEVR